MQRAYTTRNCIAVVSRYLFSLLFAKELYKLINTRSF